MNNYMNMPIPNPYFFNPNLIQEIKELETKVYKLEKEIDYIKTQLNNNNIQETTTYTNTYQSQKYNMM